MGCYIDCIDYYINYIKDYYDFSTANSVEGWEISFEVGNYNTIEIESYYIFIIPPLISLCNFKVRDFLARTNRVFGTYK